MKKERLLAIFSVLLVGLLSVTACGPGEEAVAESEQADEHMDDEHRHSPEDHMAAQHDVPEEAAAVPNPVDADASSLETGGALFATNCAICHGETGKGDGPTAETLDPKPADLSQGHVQMLSDGALFYIISHGRPETPMPAWENVLDAEQRWHVVNFLRTFR